MPSHSVISVSLQLCGLYSLPGSSCPWDFFGKNMAVDCHFLLQWILPTQGLNQWFLCFLHGGWIFQPLSHQGKPPPPCSIIAYNLIIQLLGDFNSLLICSLMFRLSHIWNFNLEIRTVYYNTRASGYQMWGDYAEYLV